MCLRRRKERRENVARLCPQQLRHQSRPVRGAGTAPREKSSALPSGNEEGTAKGLSLPEASW